MMKNKFLFIVFLFYSVIIIASCKSDDNNIIREYYPNGYVKSEYFLKDGKKEGVFKRFSNKQKDFVISEYGFKNGLQHGKSIFYFPGGKIQEVQYYENGKRQKSDTIFYESGAIEMITDYMDDKKHGLTRKFSADGSLIFEAKWDSDSLVSVNKSIQKK